MKLPRPVIFLGTLVTVVSVLAVGVALLLPRLIDSRLVRDKISAELLKKSQGSVVFGKIAFLWFPRPRVVIENAELSFADKAQGSIRSVTIYPSLVYLLAGRLAVRRVLLQEPKLTLRLPENSAKSSDLEELEEQLRSALVGFTSALPLPQIMEVADGAAEISIGGKPPVILANLAAQIAASPGELRFAVSARANLWEQIKADGKIVPQTLAAEINLGVQKLEIRDGLAMLAPESFDYAQQGKASLNVKIASIGLRQFRAAIDASVGPLLVGRHGGAATLEARRLKAGISYQAGAWQVDLEKLDLGAPRLQASGELRSQSGRVFTRLQLRDADIAQLSDLARRIAEDRQAVRIARRYVSAGIIPEITIQSAGASFAELFSSKNLIVSGSLRDGNIFIPGPDLALQNVSGSARLANGMLEADGVSANLGATKGWNGKLRVGLQDKTAPFHLDIALQAGAPEVHSLLLKLVRDEGFRSELLKLKNVEGEFSGRLILGERLDAIAPIISIAKADMSVEYAPIPFPVTIRGGRFSYDRDSVRLENAQATVGRSRFGDLGLSFDLGGSRKMRVGTKQALLDLQQVDTMLRGFKEFHGYFAKIQPAQGQIELHKLALSGAYDDPGAWVVESTGSFSQVEVHHADLPDRVSLLRGKFAANQQGITFTDTAASMADGAFLSDGKLEYKRGIPIQFETRGKGSFGPRMTQWLGRYIELPEDVKLRAPLTIAAERFAWRAGGDISFAGQVTVAGGPKLILEIVRQPQAFTLPNLTIQDGDRRARMTAQRAKDKLDLSFSGELAAETFDKVFVSLPTPPASLQGDIKIRALLSDPMSVTARGQLSGSGLAIPLGPDKVLVDHFRLDAFGDSVVIQSAGFRWGQSRFTASGTVAGAREPMRLDLDVAVDQFDWQQYRSIFGAEARRRQANKTGVMSIPAAVGTIRLKAGQATFERLSLSALEATAFIAPSEISADIIHGIVCGISAKGSVNFVGKEIGVDLQLSASDAPLEPAALCLTNQQNDVKGTYSMRARLAGRGEISQLWRAVKGNFELSARDGEFIRSPGIDATFDYLNASRDFKVAFPDLNRETFPYRFIGFKGRIEGRMLIADEVNVDSSSVNLSGQGKVDLEGKRIEGKALVAVLKPVDEVLARIPGISSMLGGSLVAIPVRIAGSFERPEVTYLPPADVGTELLSIPLRILGMPLGAMRLFTPSANPQDNDISK